MKNAIFKKFTRPSMKGFTLTELLITLSIVGILLALMYPRWANGSQTQKGQQLAADLVTLSTSISTQFANNYGNVSNAAIISGSLIKNLSTITNNGGTLTTNMGGTITIAPNKINANNDSYSITITNVFDGSCSSLATGLGRASIVLTVGANTVKAQGQAFDGSKATCSGDNTTFDAIFI